MSAIARWVASVVTRLKVVTVRMPTPSRTSERTAGMSMIARVMATSNGRSRPGRTTVRLTLVPGWPRIRSTASSRVPP